MTEHPSVEAIVSRVAEHYGVSVGAILSDRRQRRVAWPRHVAMYLCRRHTPLSLPRIGRQFRKRDHTTVMYALDKVEGQMDRYSERAEEVETLSAEVAALQPVAGPDAAAPDLYGASKEARGRMLLAALIQVHARRLARQRVTLDRLEARVGL